MDNFKNSFFFLEAVTSARRVSELQVLSIQKPFLVILEDRVVLKTDPGFLLLFFIKGRISSF